MKVAILVQGPNTHPNKIIEYYKGRENVIFSTLSNEDTSDFDGCNFVIQKNEIPFISGRANFNYQVINTLNGVKKAKSLGYEYVLKIRSDITIKEMDKLLDLLIKSEDVIYFSAYHKRDGGYLCEHMNFGHVDNLIKLWDIPVSTSMKPPETQLTENLIRNFNNINIKYIFPLLYEHNILVFWEKRNFYLNEYQNDSLFVYDKTIHLLKND